MEKDQIRGLLLISALLVVYFTFFAPSAEDTAKTEAEAAKTEQAAAKPAADTLAAAVKNIYESVPDSILGVQYGGFAGGLKGTDKDVVLENEDIKVTLASKGGKVKEVLLKKFKTYSMQPLLMADQASFDFSTQINTTKGKMKLSDLYYAVESADAKKAVFTLDMGGGKKISHTYSLSDKGYVLGYGLDFGTANTDILAEDVEVVWTDKMKRQEKDITQSRNATTINFYTASEDFDYMPERSTDPETETLEEPAKWLSMKQNFFNASFITDKQLKNVILKTEINLDTNYIKNGEASFKIPMADLKDNSANMRFYFGPNDYDVCKEVAPGFDKNVYLGWALFAFINKWLTLPIFNFLEKFVGNYGVIIFLLVLIVKTLLLPLTYRSQMSMAKTKVLKPQIDEINAKFGDDAIAKQQETMKLYNQFGIQPLLGCIPMLAQMPILFALFNFVPNAIQLRQESFLWANDLSTYDAFVNLPFEIPFYGAHVSMFTLLMAFSTLGTTYINNQMNPSQAEGPMKSIGYIMPFFLLFVLNTFSAGLTFYYFISNVITMVQQLTITRLFVDEAKILATLEENKKKNMSAISAGGGAKQPGGMLAKLQKIAADAKEKADQENEKKKNGKQ